MTTFTTSSVTDVPARGSTVPAVAEAPARRLRQVLGVNAATSAAAGLVGLLATDWCVDELGTQSAGWTRLLAAGLLLFAVDVALVARSRARLLAGALAVSIADLAWVALTVVAIATVGFTSLGVAAAVVQGLAVLDFALLQLWFRRRCAI